MMGARNHPLYVESIRIVAGAQLPWHKLSNATMQIIGATGTIGTFLVDVLQYRKQEYNQSFQTVVVSRHKETAEAQFAQYYGNADFAIIEHDVNDELISQNEATYLIHAASNTHPLAYAADPIGTILANTIGTNQLLKYASTHGTKRFVFLSSVEIYGESKDDVEAFDENYCGYLNCNTLRAGYPESKRCGEALCQAYQKAYGLDIVIPRLCRIYGPTMPEYDSKALAQFIRNALNHENIVLKSDGKQMYSYLHVADAVSGILTCMLTGKAGEAYNIADEASSITLREAASILAAWAGTEVVFDMPSAAEAAGYSKATKAVLDAHKLQALGWKARYSIKSGLQQTLCILNNIR